MANHTHAGYSSGANSHSIAEFAGFPKLISSDDSGPVGIGTDYTTLESETVEAPTNGFCIVIATADFEMTNSRDSATLIVGVTDTEGAVPGTADHMWKLPNTERGGVHSTVITVHGVFHVSAASTNEFFFQARSGEANTAAAALDWNMSVIYFPLGNE